MQRTTFPFEIIIHDDASTDNTAIIIREYAQKHPDLIFPILQNENQYSKGINPAYTFVIPKCKGKYIAVCEGDDYWTDPYKLQKQVDFLESNSDYGMVYTDYNNYFEKDNKIKPSVISQKKIKLPSGNIYEDLLKWDFVSTPTVLVRKNILEEYLHEIDPFYQNWSLGDYPLWIYAAYKSKIKYFPFVTSVYRVSTGSLTHTDIPEKRIKFLEGLIEIQLFFAKRYGASEPVLKRIYANYHKSCLLIAYYKKDLKLAKESFSYLRENHLVKIKDILYFILIKFKTADTLFVKTKIIKQKLRGW